MEMSTSQQGEFTIIETSGRLGFDESARAGEIVEQAIEAAEKGVVCDCEGLEYISSAGLRVFLIAAKSAKEQGKQFVACGLNENIMSVFVISGFERIVPLHADRQAALTALANA